MSRGFTLVEVVLALTLAGFVALMGGALVESAARSTREAESRERLLWAAGSVLDSLRRQPAWSSGRRAVGGGDRVVWTPGGAGGRIEIWLREGDRPWLVVPVGGPGALTVVDP